MYLAVTLWRLAVAAALLGIAIGQARIVRELKDALQQINRRSEDGEE